MPCAYSGGRLAENLHLAAHEPIALGVRVAHGPPDPLGLDRSGDIVRGASTTVCSACVEVRIGALDLRAVAHKLLLNRLGTQLTESWRSSPLVYVASVEW